VKLRDDDSCRDAVARLFAWQVAQERRRCVAPRDCHAQVLALINRAFALRRARRGHRLGRDDLPMQGLALSCELEQVTAGRFTYAPNRRLTGHVSKHAMAVVLVSDRSDDRREEPWAERAIRPAGQP